jgi:hypothetical protein
MGVSISVELSSASGTLTPMVEGTTVSWELPLDDPSSVSVFDPEKGLTLTDSFKPGLRGIPSVATPEIGKFTRIGSAVIAADLTGIDGTLGGLIFEIGGPTCGLYVGYGKDGSFQVRCGGGTKPLPDVTCGYLIIPQAEAPKGDGTMVVEFTPGKNTVRAWWNGKALGAPVARASGTDDIAGSNEGTYLGEANTLCSGQVATSVLYKTASHLRYYHNQKVAG